MYKCPGDDLHILYIDGEMTEAFRGKYEKHILECPKCRARLAQYNALERALSEDAERFNVNFSKEDLDKSFEHLRLKGSYARVTFGTRREGGSGKKLSIAGFAAGVAAALAVVFALPGGRAGGNEELPPSPAQEESSFTPIARTRIMSPANQVTLDGTLDEGALNALLAPDAPPEEMPGGIPWHIHPGVDGEGNLFIMAPQYTSRAAAQEEAANNFRSALTSYDLFAVPYEAEGTSPEAAGGAAFGTGQGPDAGFTIQFFLQAEPYGAPSLEAAEVAGESSAQ